MRWLRRLWERMAAIYGHRWASAYGEAPEREGTLTVAGDTWARGLAGLTPVQIGEGIDRCLASGEPWPPTLPEFRALALGIPALAVVRAEVRPGAPAVSAFTRAVWSRLDGWAYQRADADRADRMLREAYELTREAVMRGEPLPDEPLAAISQQQPECKPPATAEQARAHLARIEAELRG